MTNITIIFSRFLQKLSDYKFIVDAQDADSVAYVEEIMSDYLTTARARFVQCSKDLTVTNLADGIFINAQLSDLEIEILSLLMLVEYFKQIMIRNETLEQAVGDADFAIYSQANHINQLKDMYKELKREVNTEIGRYTYIGTVYGKTKS